MSSGEPSLEAAEAGCQLLLISPPRLDPRRFATKLEAALAVGGVAGFLLRLEDAGEVSLSDAARALRPICAGREVACLIQGEPALALEAGADGVHLTDPRRAASARAELGPHWIVGAACGTSRHLAMVAGEGGADYIAFGDPDRPPDAALLELVGWWSELFVLPCLVEGAFDIASCGRLARAGADFLGVSGMVWNHPAGPDRAIAELRQALGKA